MSRTILELVVIVDAAFPPVPFELVPFASSCAHADSLLINRLVRACSRQLVHPGSLVGQWPGFSGTADLLPLSG